MVICYVNDTIIYLGSSLLVLFAYEYSLKIRINLTVITQKLV